MYAEIRSQKIAYLKEKRRREIMRTKFLIAIAVIIVIAVFLLFMIPQRVGASSNIEQVETQKVYKSVEIQTGDSLWSIASDYYNDDYTQIHYDDINDYIKELKSMNSLSGDVIHSGANITVAYYMPI